MGYKSHGGGNEGLEGGDGDDHLHYEYVSPRMNCRFDTLYDEKVRGVR